MCYEKEIKGIRNWSMFDLFARLFLPTWTTIGTGKSLHKNTVSNKRISSMRRNTTHPNI